MKTDLTRQAEKCLWHETNRMGVFGCFEVTIGWSGTERVDYITYSTDNTIRCYEIKVRLTRELTKAFGQITENIGNAFVSFGKNLQRNMEEKE